MRVRLERYETARKRAQTRSLLAFVFGGIGLFLFGFIMFMALIMFLLPEGGIYERRAGLVVGSFFGVAPTLVSALIITWGARQRSRFQRMAKLTAVARANPTFDTRYLASALRLPLVDAESLVLEANGLGLIEDNSDSSATHDAGWPGTSSSGSSAGAHAAFAGAGAASPHAARLATPPHLALASTASTGISNGAVVGGSYRVEALIGHGGMGEVYAARHLRTGRRYALKTILRGARAKDEAIQRFEREATAASALGHPGIVQVHDFNVTPDGMSYLVMDLLEGEALDKRLERQSPLDWPEAQRLAIELCAALTAAHSHGLLHRDIKPSNIFIARGSLSNAQERAVLVDFGLVLPEGSPRLTHTGAILGTPMYMSPEQARGEPLDLRSDLYSLAAVTFETLTGLPPFSDRTMASVYARLLGEPAPRASHVARRKVPKAFDDVLSKALSKERDARYPSAQALGQALASVTDEADPAPKTARMLG